MQVVSDKEFIKQLKREVALLETKLRLSTCPARNSSDALLMEKDLHIQKVRNYGNTCVHSSLSCAVCFYGPN
jgi:ferredoxin-thioredoxin reductase catalytic subunit